MTLTLTERDLEDVHATIDSLSNPLGYGSLAAWRHGISQRTRSLLGGEMTILCGEGMEGDPIWLGRMRAFLAPTTEAVDPTGEKGAGSNLFTTKEFRRIVGGTSHGVPVQREATDSGPVLHVIGLATWGPAGEVFLSVLRTTSDRWRFGEETRSVARLLLPAFRAGVAAVAQARGVTAGANSWLEAARDSVAIYDLQGRLPLASNSQFERLSQSGGNEASLRETIADLARQLPRRPSAPSEERPTARRRISLSGREMTVRATWITQAAPLPSAGILVTVVPDCPLIPTAADIVARFGLSLREADVAGRLATGEPLAAIAASLNISPHTARHHAEAAFRKVGVHSRAELLRRLLESRQPSAAGFRVQGSGKSSPER